MDIWTPGLVRTPMKKDLSLFSGFAICLLSSNYRALNMFRMMFHVFPGSCITLSVLELTGGLGLNFVFSVATARG